MARPKKQGLSYFPLDVDFFSDKKIKALKARYGGNGIMFYLYLLTEIYREGYYIWWDRDSEDNAMIDLNLTEGFIKQVMAFFISRSLLTSILVNGDTAITSPGIQRRYREAVKHLKRDFYVEEKIWLLKEDETAAFIKVTHCEDKSEKNTDKSEKNTDKTEKNATKEKKEKEKKEKEIKEKETKENNNNNYTEANQLFTKNFGYEPTVAEEEQLSLLFSLNDREVIEYAFFKAMEKNKKNLSYVNGILKNLKRAGVLNMEDLAAYDIKNGRI